MTKIMKTTKKKEKVTTTKVMLKDMTAEAERRRLKVEALEAEVGRQSERARLTESSDNIRREKQAEALWDMHRRGYLIKQHILVVTEKGTIDKVMLLSHPSIYAV
jgi:hypothetical protein